MGDCKALRASSLSWQESQHKIILSYQAPKEFSQPDSSRGKLAPKGDASSKVSLCDEVVSCLLRLNRKTTISFFLNKFGIDAKLYWNTWSQCDPKGKSTREGHHDSTNSN